MIKKPIIVVSGEPNSVFLELFFKALKSNKFKQPLILIVSKKLLLQQMKILKYDFKLNILDEKNLKLNKLHNKFINILDVNYKFNKPFDNITNKSNQYLTKSFIIASKILKKNNCAGLINGPISKKNFLKNKFSGITEYLAKKSNCTDKVAMLIYNENLSVCPITTHLPLKKVHKNLNKIKIINQIKLIKSFYKVKFKKNPKIGVTGLNPHCESNYNTSEEDNIIIPAIKHLLKKGYKINGPFPADTVFTKQKRKEFDVIVGMYHDQVLTPAKTIFGFDAINITLGLPYIRISPDHGPNWLMLGKNLSNPNSLIKAIKFLDK
jgi:4-hydroxythreonine-4-phosphate dehydrogenase